MKRQRRILCGTAAMAAFIALTGCAGQARPTLPAAAADDLGRRSAPATVKRPQLLIKFKSPMRTAEMETFRARFGTRNVGRIDALDVWVEEIMSGMSVTDAIRAIMASGDVEYAEENQEVSIGSVRS